MVGKECIQVCMLALVCRISVVEGRKSAKFSKLGIGHARCRISVDIHELVCIRDIISGEVGVFEHGTVGVGGSIQRCYMHIARFLVEGGS